jgi:hypothetical protein
MGIFAPPVQWTNFRQIVAAREPLTGIILAGTE